LIKEDICDVEDKIIKIAFLDKEVWINLILSEKLMFCSSSRDTTPGNTSAICQNLRLPKDRFWSFGRETI
jgi:hypothetical protein